MPHGEAVFFFSPSPFDPVSNLSLSLNTMQFTTVAIFAAAVASVNAATTTATDVSSTLVTITSCGPEVTECPAKHSSSASNYTTPANVTSYEGAAAPRYGGAAIAAVAAGALLAL